MFERYTEKARRVIFFARYEASQFGQPFIETEHMLLGLLREDKALTNRFLRSHGTVESIRREIEKQTTIRERISTSVDLPLSDECKRVLAYAAEEAERLAHKHIGTEHLLLGLMREEGSIGAKILKARGIELEAVRVELAKVTAEPAQRLGSAISGGTKSLTGLYTDLTQKAEDGALEPVVGRDVELESVIEVLCKRERRNPMLLGERGVGKTAIVEALVQRIAEGNVPHSLARIRVLALSAEVLAGWVPNREKLENLVNLPGAVASSASLILFIDGLHGKMGTAVKATGQEFAALLKLGLQETGVRYIGAATPEDYKEACAANPGLDRLFLPLHVKQLNAADTLAALRARKERLEGFHEVTFADDALECAVQRADAYLREKTLPGKALELLDAAGAMVTVKAGTPDEIVECQKKIAFVSERLTSAIANHEFEKARFYSDEERKERVNLAELREKHGVENSAPVVTRDDVEQVIAKWNAYPYAT